MDKPSSIYIKWVTHKYVRPNSDLEFKKSTLASVCWKSIVRNADLVKDGLRWQVGDGTKIDISSKFWPWQWGGYRGTTFVVDLLNTSNDGWDSNKVSSLYHHSIGRSLMDTYIPVLPIDDKLVWSTAYNGIYNIADGYKILSTSTPNSQGLHAFPWKNFWRTRLPMTMRLLLFTWKLLHSAIPCGDVLRKHHLPNCQSQCPFCDFPGIVVWHSSCFENGGYSGLAQESMCRISDYEGGWC